jgi:hypothetical protein
MLVASALLVAPAAVHSVATSALAQEPYGPVGMGVTPQLDGTAEVLELRVTGLQPNSSLDIVYAGGLRATGTADAAGVVLLSLELPDTVLVEVRGVAGDGTPLSLREEVTLPREFAAPSEPAPSNTLPWAVAIVSAIVAAGATAELLRRERTDA